MSKRAFYFAVISLFIFFTGCKKRPEGILGEKEMIDLLTDIELAEAYNSSESVGRHSIKRDRLIESVLEKHGVTHEELDSTLSYYGRNMDEYYELYTQVERNLRAQGRISSEEEINEADDIWPFSRFAAFLPAQTSDGMSFSIPGDNIEKGIGLEWKMRLSSADMADILLGVEYEGGTTTLAKKNSQGGKALEIKLQTDTALKIRRIFGSMNIPERARPLWADSIRLVKSPYDSMAYYKIRSQTTFHKPAARPSKNMEGTVVADTVDSKIGL